MTQELAFAVSPKPWEPHAYQKKALKFLVEHAAAGLLLDPGLGKTSVTLAAILFLRKRHHAKKVLVIAPLRPCYLVWPKEIQQWQDFTGLRFEVLHGDDKDEALEREADIYIINPDGLPWLTGAERKGKTGVAIDTKRWRDLGFDLLVVDELSKFKHPKTRRFKILKSVLPTFKRRWGLTGSPASNGLIDLFGQMYVLDLGKALGQFITHYRTKYFVPPMYGFKWVLQEGKEKEIYKKVSHLVLRMSAEDHLQLPEKLDNIIRVDLPPKAMKTYQEMEDELITVLEDDVVTAANAAAAAAKCRQVASGAVYTADPLKLTQQPGRAARAQRKRAYAEIHDAKLDALEDLVDELQGQPLLVGYEFQHDLERIRKRLGKNIPALAGGVTMKETKRIEAEWHKGNIPILLAHPQAAAHGLNLQGTGAHVAWFSLTWDYELFDQFVRRVYRQGTKAKYVTIHMILARGTIDEAILGALRSKAKGQNALFSALKELRASRRKSFGSGGRRPRTVARR